MFDRLAHRRRLNRAAPHYEDFLKVRACTDMIETLEAILRDFPVAVDLGSRHGTFRQILQNSSLRGRISTLIETDLSEAFFRPRPGGALATLSQSASTLSPRLVCDEEHLPFVAESLNLVVSSLALHWVNDLPGALIQIRRALAPDGLFMGTFFGGATLKELRFALTQAEIEILGGTGPRISPFADAHDAAGLLQRAGFALPVADIDRLTIRYQNPLRLLADLRQMGETNVLIGSMGRPLRRDVLARALELYVQTYQQDDGKVPATFELVTASGWAPHESQQKPLRPGSARMSLADALKIRPKGG